MARRSRMVLAQVVLVLVLVGCPTSPAPGVSDAVVSVSIDQHDVVLVVGATTALSATVEVAGGASDAVVWSSGDEALATVSDEGVVTGVAVGEAVITVASSFDGSRSDSITVTVLADDEPAVLSMPIDQEDMVLEVGQTTALSVTVTAVGGASTDVNVGARTVFWAPR